ncbi:hypothetical protein J2T09_002941 [Neorhizobium huautlense]|uniref:Secreted protein n=2 Tax=Neorhizobium huautlense TaxID=67774 RepID=A0ABT9PWB9_9HYPH|nr:hypothetical protein [Neorhizobium huautlense]
MKKSMIGAVVTCFLFGLSVPMQATARDYLRLVASDCGDAASKVVRDTGGQLLSASPSNDGRTCIITVLVQGSGERPRKVTVRVPM